MITDTTGNIIVDTTIIEMEEADATDGIDQRRRKTDMSQPLDYVAKELVSEFIENAQRQALPSKSFIQKLFHLN